MVRELQYVTVLANRWPRCFAVGNRSRLWVQPHLPRTGPQHPHDESVRTDQPDCRLCLTLISVATVQSVWLCAAVRMKIISVVLD